MTPSGYIAVALFLVTFILLLLFGAFFIGDPIVGTLISLALTSLVSAIPFLFPGIRQRFEAFAKKHIFIGKSNVSNIYLELEGSYRVLVYGLPGSGKTTLIKNMLSVSAPHVEISTDEYDVYQNEVTLSLKPLRKMSVAVADYKGDKPSQIIVSPPQDFFGEEGNKKINAIIFVVDMFPRSFDECGNPLVPDKTRDFILESYKKNTLKLIKNRVKETKEYITKWDIEEVFTVAFNKTNLRSVRLVINKIDLLRAIIEAGYVPGVSVASLENYALKAFSEIERNISMACEQNIISDFSTCLISAASGENVGSMLGQILALEGK
jgi:GTPase SAR1 family protein